MLLVSCGADIKLHSCLSFDLLHVYNPADSTGHIRNISWCRDGSWLALVPNRGNVEIIRTKNDVRLLQTIQRIPQPTAAVFQRTTKRSMAMSTVSGNVFIYDIKDKSIKKEFENFGSSVTMLDWSLKDTHLVAGSTDGQVTLYSNTTNQNTSVFSLPESKSVSAVRFHSTQRSILGTASDEGVVVVWDINKERQKMCLKPHKAPVTDLVFSSQNDKLMISVGLDRTFQCYDTNAGVVALPVLTDHPLSAVDMATDGFTVAVGSSRGTIYVYDLRQHEKPVKTIAAHSGEIKKILFQPYALDSSTDSLVEDKPMETLEPKSSHTSVDSSSNNELSSKLNNENNEQLIEQDEEVKIINNSAAGDSFIISIEKSDSINTRSLIKEKPELSNLGLSDSVKKWLEAKKNKLVTHSSTSCNISNGNGRLSDLPMPGFKITSTPAQQSRDRVSSLKIDELRSPNVSPILPEIPTISAEDLSKIVNSVKDVVNSAVKEAVTSVVSEQIADLTESLSRFFLTLQLVLSKQFVGQESHMEKLFDYYCAATGKTNLAAQVQQLTQENEFLRSKVDELLRKNNF